MGRRRRPWPALIAPMEMRTMGAYELPTPDPHGTGRAAPGAHRARVHAQHGAGRHELELVDDGGHRAGGGLNPWRSSAAASALGAGSNMRTSSKTRASCLTTTALTAGR